MEGFKSILLYKLQLVASHKLYITSASAISLEWFVDWLTGLCVIVLQWSNTLFFLFILSTQIHFFPGMSPRGLPLGVYKAPN